MVNESPLFLVGASRCGTTLLLESMCRHPNIHISSETHWFDDDRCQRHADLNTPEESTTVQNWFMSLSHRPFGHSGDPEQGWLERSVFEDNAEKYAASETQSQRDKYFTAYCKLDAERNGKKRWGEKTPRHVFRVKEMIAAYPDAKVICALRDARAMVNSYRQWSFRESHDLYSDNSDDTLARERKRSRDSYHPVIAAMLWRGAARASLNAVQGYGESRVKVICYENLVKAPEKTLSDLTEWLDEPFDPTMMSVPLLNSSFDEFEAGAGFQHQAIDRWREALSRSELASIRLLCKKEMEELGYKFEDETSVFWPLRAIPQFVTLPGAIFRAWRANRDRAGNPFSYIWRRISA